MILGMETGSHTNYCQCAKPSSWLAWLSQICLGSRYSSQETYRDEAITMRRALALAPILVMLGSSGQFASRPATAATVQWNARATVVSTSKEHLTLVMQIPSRLYTRGASVPVRLQLHNSSSGDRVLWTWDCHTPPYGAQVLTRSGKVVFPVSRNSRGRIPVACAANMAPALLPGRSITYHVTVVLNGPLIRAQIPFGIPKQSGDTQEILSTRAIAVGNF